MSACWSEPHSSSAVWQYMLKIDASFGEKEWDSNPRPEYQSDTLSYHWAHHWTQHRRVKASLHIASQSQGRNWFQLHFSHTAFIVYKWRFPAGSTMPERILSLPTTTASGNSVSQCIVTHYTTGIKCIKAVAGGCSQFLCKQVYTLLPPECGISMCNDR